MTYEMMTDPDIAAAGVISVVSNIAPKAMVELVDLLRAGKTDAAKTLARCHFASFRAGDGGHQGTDALW